MSSGGHALALMPAAIKIAPAFSRQVPLNASMVRNTLLSGAGAQKKVRHFAFDIAGSGFSYRAGDALGVLPSNCLALVREVLERLDFRAMQS